jgi:hypothetical protein
MGWAGYMARYGERENEYLSGFRCGNLKDRDNFEDLGIDGKILLK